MVILNKSRDDIFNENLEILKKRFPHIIKFLDQCLSDDPFNAFFNWDRSGQPSIHIQGPDGCVQTLYSRSEHQKLLKRIADAELPDSFDMVFILGLGLGEAGLEAVRRYQKKPRIVIIEPYLSLFRLALFTKELGLLLNYERLSLYVGKQANTEQIIEDCKRMLPVGRTLLFIYPYQQQLIGKKYKQLESGLIHHIRKTRDMWHTTRRFGRQMLMNTIANLPSLLDGVPLRVLRNRFKGKPIICVAAGPSLNHALPLLKEVDNTLIIACDSAVGSLLIAGIQPHIVATADIHPSNIDKLKPHMDRLRNTVLAFGVESNPENVRTFPGQRRVGMTAYSRLVLDWLDHPLDLRCRVPTMTSVMHLSVLLSIAMGGDPIILVGIDMAYLEGKSHAHGSVNSRISKNESLIPVKSVDGSIVYAPAQLVTDRLILEQIIAQHAVRVINVSMAGALVNGAEVKSLKNVISNELTSKHDVQQLLDDIPWEASPAKHVVKTELHKVINQFKELEKKCRQQHERITNTLKMRNQSTGKEMFEKEGRQLKENYNSFQRQYGSIIESLHDAMLNELQAIIKKEEIAAVTPVDCKEEKVAGDLEMIDVHYSAITDIVGLLIDELETILNRR